MTGQVINAMHDDSIRITGPDGSVVQLPAAFVLAADRVLTWCRTGGRRLTITSFGGSWFAHVSPDQRADRSTPWGAIVALAETLKGGDE